MKTLLKRFNEMIEIIKVKQISFFTNDCNYKVLILLR